MAIWSINNIVESVRFQKTPYWKLFRTQADKEAGNVIASADFSNPNLGMEDALDMLRKALQRQTPGRYILSAYDKPDGKRGGVSSDVEVENSGLNTVSGIGSVAEKVTTAYVEGIGLVSLDNIGDVIDKKITAIRLKEKEEQRIKNLEEENRRLKTEAREYETGINKGLLSIGSIIWEKMRGTTTGKEVLGMFSDIKKLSNDHQPAGGRHPEPAEGQQPGDDNISGAGGDEVPQAMVNALDVLAKDNPQLVTQLQMLAKVKTETPDLFQDAIENLKVIAG